MTYRPFLCPCCDRWKLHRGMMSDEICSECDGSDREDWLDKYFKEWFSRFDDTKPEEQEDE